MRIPENHRKSGSPGDESVERSAHSMAEGSGTLSARRSLEAINALQDGVALTDPAGKIGWSNPSLAQLLEAPAHQLEGASVAILAGPYAGDREGLTILEMVRAGAGSLEATVISSAGNSIPCLIRVVVLPGGDRMVLVSEERERESLRAELTARAEIATRERALLKSTADALDHGVIVLDDAERLVIANQAALRVLGCSLEGLRGRGLADIPLPGQVRGAWLTFLSARVPTATMTARMDVQGKPRVVLLRLGRAVSHEGTPLGSVLVARDLSAETVPERARQRYVGEVAHELRTPLQSIHGFAQTLVGEPGLDVETRSEFAGIILEESRRLRSVVERLLTMLGQGPESEVVDRRRHDLAHLLEQAAARVAERRGIASRIEIEPPRGETQVWVDAAALGRAFEQVIENAATHGDSPAGVRISVRGSATSVRVEIRDWGAGVPAEDLERIFDPFYQPQSAGAEHEARLGLGLPLCRHVVERHGGEVIADLPRGGGLKVAIVLPRG